MFPVCCFTESPKAGFRVEGLEAWSHVEATAPYIASWLEVLKNDKRATFQVPGRVARAAGGGLPPPAARAEDERESRLRAAFRLKVAGAP
jgi:antirestriction protein ArdC